MFFASMSVEVVSLPITSDIKSIGDREAGGYIETPEDIKARNEAEYVLYKSAQEKFSEGDLDGARKGYLKSLNANPIFFPSMIGLAEIEDKYGNRGKAEEFFQKAFSAAKNSAFLHTAYGRFLFKHQDIIGAKKEFEKALSINPKRPDANVELAVIYLSHFNDPKKSIQYYHAAIEGDPDNVAYLYGLSSAQAAFGDVDAAVATLKTIADKLPSNALPWQYMGIQYSRAGRFNEAVAALKKSIEINPQQEDARWLLAETYAVAKRSDSALKEYQWLIDNSDKKDVAYLKQGIVYQLAKDFKKSKAAYLQAIEANPNLADAYNNLAYLTLETKGGSKEGLQWAQKAVSLNPDNAVFLDTLGWLYYQVGDYSNAQKQLDKAAKSKPELAEVHYHLGKVYEKLNDKAAANRHFSEAKRIDKHFEPVQ